MAYLRDRRAFGNIGTRKFRGARFGDALSPRFSGLLDQYGGAAAAYSLRALSTGWLAGDVVEVRRSSDSTSDTFTAGQVTGGQMLDFVNGGTSDLYNNAMYFDGVDDSVTGVSLSISDGNSIEFMLVADSVSGSPYALSDGGNSLRVSSAYSVRLRVSSVNYTFGGGLSNGVKYKIKVTKSGGNVTVLVNDVSVGTQAIPDFSFDRVGNLGATYLKGTIYNIKENDVVKYIGDGVANSNWLDQIGGNNGTVNGTPAAYAGQPFDGFVSTWYDQSGFANNATQATTTAQPKIVSAGALVVGGLDFDGVDDWLLFTGTGLDIFKNVGYGQTFNVVTSSETGVASARILSVNSPTDPQARYLIGDSAATAASFRVGGRRLDADLFDSTTATTAHGNTEKLLTGFLNWSDAEAYLYQNSVSVGTDLSFQTVGLTSNTSSNATSGIGGGTFDGLIREVIIYNSDQSANRVGIETNINAEYTIY